MIDKLYKEAEDHNLEIIENIELPNKLKGLLINNKVLLDKKLTKAERIAILAEEIEHKKLTVGNIIDIRDLSNMKQELLARWRTYEKLLKFDMIINAIEYGVSNTYEFSEFVELPEDFIVEAINYYRQRYGTVKYNGYEINFINQLYVTKL